MTPRYLRPWHFVAAAVARLCWFAYFHHLHGGVPKGMRDGAFILDTQSYLGSIESLLAGTGYDPDLRMPGYGMPYLLLRLVMDRGSAITGMILLNLLSGILSSVLLASLTFLLTGRRRIANTVFVLYLLVPFVVEYDHQLLTESLATSTLIACAWSLARWRQQQCNGLLVLAGILFCWSVFLRPVSGALLPVFLLVVWSVNGEAASVRLRRAVLFALPFVVAETAWVARNWTVHRAFRPLTNGFWEKSISENPVFPITRFVMSYGGYYVFWDPEGDINWFMDRPDGRDGTIAPAPPDDPRIPEAILCPSFDRDSLELIARDYHRMAYGGVSPAVADSLRREVALRADRYREAFERERPWQYHVVARWRSLKRFIVHSGTERVFSRAYENMGGVARALKILWAALFVGSVIGGLFWSLWSLFRARTVFDRLVPAMVLIGVLIYPVGFRLIEYRYIVATWPFALVMAAIGTGQLADRWFRRSSSSRDRSIDAGG